ncbi:MAG: hypothetical protein U0W24_26180 [Bacteroidales bacterium]
MKKIKSISYKVVFIGLILFFISSPGFLKAQLSNTNSMSDYNPRVLFGLGISFNEYGAGVGMEFPVAPRLSFLVNAGLGGWGWKLNGGMNLYFKQVPYQSSLSIGYSLASGLEDFKTELEVSGGTTETVVLDLYKISTINLVYNYNLKVGQASKFVFSAGVAFCLTSNPYDVQSQGITLSSTSEQVLQMMQPGGLVAGIKFMFGK